MLPGRALSLLAAFACFLAAIASIPLGVWALASTDDVTTVDVSEEIRDEVPEEHATPVEPGEDWPPAHAQDARRVPSPHRGIGPRHGHLRDVHRPPEA